MRSHISGIQIPTDSRINIDGGLTLDSLAGTAGQVLTSAGAGATPTWTTISGGGSGFTGAGTSITSILGANVSPVLYESITSASITFKSGNATGTVFSTPTATSGDINILTGNAEANNVYIGSITIGNGQVLYYDGEYGSAIQGNINIGNAHTNATNIIGGFGGVIIKSTSSAGSGIRINSSTTSGTLGPVNIGYNNTVATTVNIGSDITTSKVQIWGPLLQNYTVTARNSGTFLYTELLGGVITSATGGATITLPTGANMDNIYSDTSGRGFQWSVINTAASSITIANNSTSHLRVGSGTIAATSSARFMTMRTGLSIWTTYRIS